MRLDYYGPVPVSRLKTESSQVYDALAASRRVLVSRHGRIVAVIDPSGSGDTVELAAYAVGGEKQLPELTATDLNRGSPSEAIRQAEEGATVYFTKAAKVYGFLRGIHPGDHSVEGLTLEQIRERESRIARYLEEHPDASADEFAKAAAEATRSLIEEPHVSNGIPETAKPPESEPQSTDKARQAFALIADGRSVQETAKQLNLSVSDVRKVLLGALHNLGLRRRRKGKTVSNAPSVGRYRSAAKLSPSQREVFARLGEGASVKQIAARMSTTTNGVSILAHDALSRIWRQVGPGAKGRTSIKRKRKDATRKIVKT